MRPPERRETGEQDLFRSRLDQIIDLKHPLVALGRTVDWGFLDGLDPTQKASGIAAKGLSEGDTERLALRLFLRLFLWHHFFDGLLRLFSHRLCSLSVCPESS